MKKLFISIIASVCAMTISAQTTADVTLRLQSQSGSVSELYLFAGPDLAAKPERGSFLVNASNPEDINIFAIDPVNGNRYSSFGNEDLENIPVAIITSKEEAALQKYTIHFQVYEAVETLKLKDLVTGIETEITNGGSYEFTINTATDPSYIEGNYSVIANRFIINDARDTKEYEVNYSLKDSYIFVKETITLNVPVAPEIEGFTFQGWDVVAGHLEDGIVLQAVYTSDEPTSAPEVVVNPANPSQKLVRNGQVYILRDNATYTLQGQMVK